MAWVWREWKCSWLIVLMGLVFLQGLVALAFADLGLLAMILCGVVFTILTAGILILIGRDTE